MDTRIRLVIATGVLLAAQSAAPLAPASARGLETTFFFPRVVLIRGGHLTQPVTLTHRSEAGKSPIGIIYSSLSRLDSIDLLRLATESHYDVAEFLGPPTQAELVLAQQSRSSTPLFASASHFSKIYPATSRRPVVWESPVVTPGGIRGRFFTLSDSAQRVLERLGVALH